MLMKNYHEILGFLGRPESPFLVLKMPPQHTKHTHESGNAFETRGFTGKTQMRKISGGLKMTDEGDEMSGQMNGGFDGYGLLSHQSFSIENVSGERQLYLWDGNFYQNGQRRQLSPIVPSKFANPLFYWGFLMNEKERHSFFCPRFGGLSSINRTGTEKKGNNEKNNIYVIKRCYAGCSCR